MTHRSGWKPYQRWICLLFAGCLLVYLLGGERQLVHQIEEALCHRTGSHDSCDTSVVTVFPHSCHSCLSMHPNVAGSLAHSTGTVSVAHQADAPRDLAFLPPGSRLHPVRKDRAPPA